MSRRQLLIACLCLFSLLMTAQTYTGSVCDTQGRPLPRASVSAKSTGNKVVAFSLTDKEGRFKLTVGEKKASMIVVSMMGYATKSVAIESFKNGSKIVLEEQVQQLKEVKVKQQRVRQEGDTLVYSVAGFKQKNDRTIADVLARMPGIMVNDNGSITYQGETINSFYVEGMDLMGNGYAQISENL
ncbi:MAG: carboxypeptidase-like regulatory domain-containing protein, partial [Aeriscardovia sp.]|nr:carboxypeptidase-like regulatory domain-containing protein [Aeriscardovia sp.]